jgi:hypothetical protein
MAVVWKSRTKSWNPPAAAGRGGAGAGVTGAGAEATGGGGVMRAGAQAATISNRSISLGAARKAMI